MGVKNLISIPKSIELNSKSKTQQKFFWQNVWVWTFDLKLLANLCKTLKSMLHKYDHFDVTIKRVKITNVHHNLWYKLQLNNSMLFPIILNNFVGKFKYIYQPLHLNNKMIFTASLTSLCTTVIGKLRSSGRSAIILFFSFLSFWRIRLDYFTFEWIQI